MKTPVEYVKNLKQGIVTTEMMCDALYSVNKRAKNYRDLEREARQYKQSYGDGHCATKEALYEIKESLLIFLKPVCIHKEFAGYDRVRVYDYQSNYNHLYLEKLLSNKIVWKNSYFNDYEGEVCFFDYEDDATKYRYYLYYICGTHTFHTPIEEKDIKKYNLDVVEIDTLNTYGDYINDLISLQFSKKILEALQTGSAKYVKTMEDNPPVFDIYEKDDYCDDIDENTVRHAINFVSDELEHLIKRLTNEIDELVYESEKTKIEIKQKYSGKKKEYKEPKLSTFHSSVLKPLKQDDSIRFILNELLKQPSESKRYETFYKLCATNNSPFYDEIIKYVKRCNAKEKARNEILHKAKQLYRQDHYKKIINDHGVVRYAD